MSLFVRMKYTCDVCGNVQETASTFSDWYELDQPKPPSGKWDVGVIKATHEWGMVCPQCVGNLDEAW